MISPKGLPLRCPTCDSAIESYDWRGVHAYGWDMESSRYGCGARLEWMNKIVERERCPKSAEALALRAREDELDAAVAAALVSASATRDEAVALAQRAYRGITVWQFTGREGVWRFLPRALRGEK